VVDERGLALDVVTQVTQYFNYLFGFLSGKQ
jgi:hypothetical protein